MNWKIVVVALCAIVLLTACSRVEQPEPPPPSDAEPPASSSEPEHASSLSEDNPAPEMEERYARVLLGQYREDFQKRHIAITGTNLVVNGDHTFTFTLLLENQDGNSFALPVKGTYADDSEGTFAAATWGGISLLDDEVLAVYTKGEIILLSGDALEEKEPRLTLSGCEDCWVLGVCRVNGGYAAVIGGVDVSGLVYLDPSGNVIQTVAADNPASFRVSDMNYFTRKDRYTAGQAFTTYPSMETIRFDNPNREMFLLQQRMHSAWAAYDGNDGGQLDNYLIFDPKNGAIINASEDYYRLEGDRRYTVLHYTGSDPSNRTGYMGMYYENDKRAAAIAFAGPPTYLSMDDEGIEWTIAGKRADIYNSLGCQYIALDFEKMTGSAEYRFTQDNLSEDVLATSPSGRYSLQAVNTSGAGDGYWGQVVLVDREAGNIDYVCNMPVRYGGDAASTNFADDRYFTTADGRILNIHTVDAPDRYRTVELRLPGDDSNVVYCNSIYDIQNNRYLLAYLDDVGVDSGGWHEYEAAVYHVAVFDSALRMTGEVVVPGLEITHSLYAMPCPDMVWDGSTLVLDGIPVDLQ